MKWLNNVDLAQNQLLNARIQNLASAPASPVSGQLYYDTGTTTLYYWNGSSWVAASGGSVSFGSVASSTTFGQASVTGVASTVSHSDHLHGTPTHDDAAHSTIHHNALAAPTAAVSWNGQSLTNLAAPVNPGDAATKAYVDAAAAGYDTKASARVATTANVALATGGLLTVDGVTVVAGDRVLVKNQTTTSENGVYVAAAGAWTRATDAAQNSGGANGLNPGSFVFVEQGTANGATAWLVTTQGPITVGTTGVTWAQVGSQTTYTAGNGLTLAGNQFSAVAAAAGGLSVAAGGISVDTSVVARKFSQTIGDGSSTSYALTHNLGTQDIHLSVREVASNNAIIVDWTATSTTQATVTFAVAPATNTYRVTVIG
jgi:hypothetical protein